MFSSLIGLAVVFAAIAVAWKVAKAGLMGLVYTINLAAVTALVAPGAYAAGKAEKALPERDLAFDFIGNQADASAFNTIVRDRMRRSRMLAMHTDLTMIATRIGRRLALA